MIRLISTVFYRVLLDVGRLIGFFSGFTRVWFSYTWMFHRQCFFARMIRSWNFHSLDLAMFYRVFVCLFVCFFFKWELREAGKVPTDQRFSMTGTDENKKNDSDRFSMWSLLFGGWKWPIFLVDIASFPFGFSRRWVRASRQSNDVGQRYRISFYTPTRFFSGPFFSFVSSFPRSSSSSSSSSSFSSFS